MHALLVVVGVHVAVDLVRPAGVVAEMRGREGDVRALGEGVGLAVVQRLQVGEALHALLDELRDLVEKLAALLAGHAGPGALVEGRAGGGDGGVDVGLAGGRELANLLAGTSKSFRRNYSSNLKLIKST